MSPSNELDANLGKLTRLSQAKTRSISAENFTGEKGKGGMAIEGRGKYAARDLGQGWKVSPCIDIQAGETVILAEIEGPGAIQSMWYGGTGARDHHRTTILRIYWEDQDLPSVECPLGDFFASGWGYAQIDSIPVAVNPNTSFNCFWPMPFRHKCRITIQNLRQEQINCFYQINYTLSKVPDDLAYFHAQFRRTNPLAYGEAYTIVNDIQGQGQYVGTAMAWGTNNNGWFSEGEIKFFIDGDDQFPTICGTGVEDYFGGSYGWVVDDQYRQYSTPYLGVPQIIRPDGVYHSQQRFAMYRWHIQDPIRFQENLRLTIQALGWRNDGRHLPLQDDISSVGYWYQSLPTSPFPDLPNKDYLEII